MAAEELTNKTNSVKEELKHELPENLKDLDLEKLFNQTPPTQAEIVFGFAEGSSIIGFYSLVLLLGLVFNGAIIWVIMGNVLFSSLNIMTKRKSRERTSVKST